MNQKSKKLLAKYSYKDGYVLYVPPSNWVAFGEGNSDDMVIRWMSPDDSSHAFLLKDGDPFDVPEQKCRDLFQTICSLSNQAAFGIVSLSAAQVDLLKQSIDAMQATHLRIFGEMNKIKVHVFDYRKFVTTTRIKRKHPHSVEVLQLRDSVCSNFSCTLKAHSFKRLKPSDYLVRVGRNGIVEFTSAEEPADFLFRDQDLMEPVVTFNSPVLNQEIAFVPHPKS